MKIERDNAKTFVSEKDLKIADEFVLWKIPYEKEFRRIFIHILSSKSSLE